MARATFHPEAQAEYEDAILWYQTRSRAVSLRFENEVERVIRLIETNPEGFAKYDDFHRFALLRRFPYSVVYQAFGNTIFVVAVAHGSRLPGYWSERT